MEAEAAVALWRRSLQYNMIYKTFVSDGDSSAFRSVCEMNRGAGPYGVQCPVVKAECINHVANRHCTGLCALKKTDADKPATWGGRHKLTDVVIDHLQFYFQESLNRKVGTTASEMHEEIMSTFFHCTSTDNPQHDRCAKGERSWCFYNRSIALGQQPHSHTTMKVYFCLEEAQKRKIKGIYDTQRMK